MARNGTKSHMSDTAPTVHSNTSHVSGAGPLIIIGGHEDKEGDREILARVAEVARHEKILVATLASSMAEEVWKDYERAFRALGVREVEHLDIPDRSCSLDSAHVSALKGT